MQKQSMKFENLVPTYQKTLKHEKEIAFFKQEIEEMKGDISTQEFDLQS
jgi:hypothetical protein